MTFCQNKSLKFLFLIFSLFLTLSAEAQVTKTIDASYNLLTPDEKRSLEYFFSTAIKKHHLGHVLFFSKKPASLLGSSISSEPTEDNELFLKGWKVWKEKEPYFPHPNFIIHHENVVFSNGNSALHIYFINKQTLSNFMSAHEDHLKEILGENFSKIDLIRDLEERKIKSLFDSDQAFLGLLLGFGLESSQAFKKNKSKKNESSQQLKFILCIDKDKVNIKESSSNKNILIFNEKAKVFPVSFLGDPTSPEVRMLQENYSNELEKIEKIFDQKDLLKITLEALCSEHAQ